MPVIFFILWVFLSALVGWLGRDRAIGFAGFFVLSLLFTPFVMALVLVVSVPRGAKLSIEDSSRSND